jgi:hypothetical protein
MESAQHRKLHGTPTSHLDGLPDELLLQIFGYLPEPKTRAHLCLVNRHLSRVATPLLYHAINTPRYDDVITRYELLLYRTLVQRPDLGQHAKRVAWCCTCAPYTTDELHLLPSNTAASLRAREEQIAAEAAAAESDGHRRYGDVQSDALLSNALMTMPSIKDLMLTTDLRATITLGKRGPTHLDTIRICNLPMFEHLKSVHVETCNIQLRDVAWLMGMPSLQRLFMKGFPSDAWQEGTWPLDRKSSNVQDVTLSGCLMHSNNLVNLIDSCKVLVRFSFIECRSSWWSLCNIAALEKALKTHQGQLVRLRLDVTFRSVGMEESVLDLLSDFSNYSVLEELEISDFDLLKEALSPITSRLPVSLRILHVRSSHIHRIGMQVGPDGIDWLKELARNNHANKGPLELIYVNSRIAVHCDEWMDVQKACAALGLEVKIWEHRFNKDLRYGLRPNDRSAHEWWETTVTHTRGCSREK